MGNKESFLKELRPAAEKAASENGCSIISTTFGKSSEGRTLKIVIDGEDTGLSVCEKISKSLSRWLDEHESLVPAGDYSLEVSSPGLDRPLKTEADFRKLVGKLVYIETKTKAADGRKRYTGRLEKIENGVVTVFVEKENVTFDIALADISKARAEYDFREE